MVTYNVHEAKTHFSRLLARVAAGEEVVIAKSGKAVARIVPIRAIEVREPSPYYGKLTIDDDFDAPLPDHMLDDFEGRS